MLCREEDEVIEQHEEDDNTAPAQLHHRPPLALPIRFSKVLTTTREVLPPVEKLGKTFAATHWRRWDEGLQDRHSGLCGEPATMGVRAMENGDS